jgi:hypothetical protein
MPTGDAGDVRVVQVDSRSWSGLLTVGPTIEAAAWWYIAIDNAERTQLIDEPAGPTEPIQHKIAKLTAGQVGTHKGRDFSFHLCGIGSRRGSPTCSTERYASDTGITPGDRRRPGQLNRPSIQFGSKAIYLLQARTAGAVLRQPHETGREVAMPPIKVELTDDFGVLAVTWAIAARGGSMQ